MVIVENNKTDEGPYRIYAEMLAKMKKRKPGNGTECLESMDLTPYVKRDGNFIMVALCYPRGSGIIGMGCAKRNPIDKDDPDIGMRIATMRAIRHALSNI